MARSSPTQGLGAGDQGLRREPQPAAGRPRRDRLHARRRVSDAWKGNAEAGFKSRSKSCARSPAIYPNYIQIVAAADSGIKTLADLKGKRISVGAPKSGTETQRARHPQGRRAELQGFRQGRVPALRRVGRTDEEPPARRHAAVGRPRRRRAARPATAVKVNFVPFRPRSWPRSATPPTAGRGSGQHLRGPDRAEVPTVAIQNFLVTTTGCRPRSPTR
jgi:hypothetical protein